MYKNEVLNEIIIGYRNVVKERYNHTLLKDKYDLLNTIDAEIVEEIKTYFLTYIYPDLKRRKELNEAFNSLDSFLKSPKKLLSLIVQSFKLAYKHGKHLPKISDAGFKALKSYRAATNFENQLVKVATRKKVKPPYTTQKINSFIKQLSLKEINTFISKTESLFNVMHDKELIGKIKEVIGFLINKMENISTFSDNEIQGLKAGLEMIVKGEELLNSLKPKDQKILIDLIVKIEKDNLKKIHSS